MTQIAKLCDHPATLRKYKICEEISLNVRDAGRGSYERALDATRKLEIREFYVNYVKKPGKTART